MELDEVISRVCRKTRAEVAASRASAHFYSPSDHYDADVGEEETSSAPSAPASQEVNPTVVNLDEDMDHEHEVKKAMEYHAAGTSRSSEEVADYLPVGRGVEDGTQEAEVIEIEDDADTIQEVEVIEIDDDDDDGDDGEEVKMVGLDSDSSDG